MKKAYKIAKYSTYVQKTINSKSINHTVRRLTLFSVIAIATTLLLSMPNQSSYEACDDIYIITDLHYASIDVTTPNESITNEVKELKSQSHRLTTMPMHKPL